MQYVSKELRNVLFSFLNMLKISSATAEDKLDPIYREVEAGRIHSNYISIIPSSLVLLVVEICGIIYNVVCGSSIKYQIIYIVAFIIFLINTLIMLFFINKELGENNISDKKKEAICYIYWVIYTLSAMSFSVFEGIDTGSINHFFVFVFAITLWPTLEPALTLPYYFFSIAVQTALLYMTGAQYTTYVLCFIFTAIGIIASYIKYSAYMTKCIDSKRLARMAEVDPLTGLLNRRGMQHSVDGIWDYCKSHQIPVTVAMLDIDYFKLYNDKFGHSSGDECLKRISSCIRSCFSRRTDITSRYGGEEFIIILAGENEQQSVMSFVNLQNKIEQLHLEAGNQQFNKYVTVSMGVYSTIIDDGVTFKQMVLSADAELYNAKENGRKCLSFRGELYNKETEN